MIVLVAIGMTLNYLIKLYQAILRRYKNMTCTFTNESCFDLLPRIKSNTIDLILIDPPYEISRPTNFQSGTETGTDTDRFRISMDFGEWDKNFSGLEQVIAEAYRILRPGGTIICFYDLWKIETLKNLYEKNKFKQIRFIEWLKTNPVPINSKINYLTNAREVAVSAIKVSKPTFNSSYDNAIYQYSICRDKGRFHPTQKPLNLIADLIKKHSNENDVVLDCFAGSCTTGVAALQNNRSFIGCELDSNYYTKAVDRLQPWLEQAN
jgi:DNA modification methylase